MNDIYKEQILDHYKNPRNFGELNNPDVSSSDNLVSCGDQLSFFVKLNTDKTIITEVKFNGDGCAISMASASLLTEYILDKNISDLKKLNRDGILNMLGISLSPTRLKCALLPLEVLHKALNRLT